MARPRKSLGQHFLHHRAILERIAAALEAPPGARVLEIGPGSGALTGVLVERQLQVTAIEKDPELAAEAATTIPGARIITGDALQLDWRELIQAGDEPWYVAGNIPYNITSPLIARALSPPRPARIVFLVQEEVADRISAPAGTRTYGALSVGVQAVAQVARLFRVPAGAFHPRPRVDSAVITIVPRAPPLVPDGDLSGFRSLVTGLFGFRRKQLGRGIRELRGLTAEQALTLLGSLGFDPADRPERLSPAEFVRLYRALIDWEGGSR